MELGVFLELFSAGHGPGANARIRVVLDESRVKYPEWSLVSARHAESDSFGFHTQRKRTDQSGSFTCLSNQYNPKTRIVSGHRPRMIACWCSAYGI